MIAQLIRWSIANRFLVMLATLPDYGLTYDEEPHVRLGERVLEFYTGGFIRSGSLTRSVFAARNARYANAS